MSEAILKALMQLFALITKQDGGISQEEIDYVNRFLVEQIGVDSAPEYLELYKETALEGTGKELTSVLDSVRVLKLCKQISKTINQRQKVVVLIRILELVSTQYQLTAQRLGIVETVSDIFRIEKDEYKALFTFVTSSEREDFHHPNHLVVSKSPSDPDDIPLQPRERAPREHQLQFRGLDAPLYFLRVPSVQLYFMKYTGAMECFLNGLTARPGSIHVFAQGSTLRFPVGPPILFSDVTLHFLARSTTRKITLEAKGITYHFPGRVAGLQDVSFSAQQGNLVGILGSSGSGKTTLLNILSGMYTPDKGSVQVNGLDLQADASRLAGVLGFVPQDDLLIEELSVFDNLYFNARFCFKNLPDKEIREKVTDTLKNLGLYEKRNLKVGSVMNKTISGGQRKRLNIALELIREPFILFLDEPTSGLSSRDSENVMDLLRDLTQKGKLVFVVIHQPSSDLFKMFDRVVILDEGGRMVFFGNPVEAVMHFKRADQQVNANVGECPVCGNVNPELIFNILEARQLDEFGNYTDHRKVRPETWEQIYRKSLEPATDPPAGGKPPEAANKAKDPPPSNLDVPGWPGQLVNYFRRDVTSKLNNTQYLLLTLLVSPVLALILSSIIRYVADPASQTYVFRENENIPIYIFMALIVMLFLGLIVSAEEIFRDRKILRREKFLHLSRSSYLVSKVGTLVLLSAIQSIAFVLIANNILEVRNMTFPYWMALFSTAVCANMIGLLISSAFNSAVTIYIAIPLIMIPMMVLSGAMFSFDKLNRRITHVDKVPFLAELMPTKWSYEALMVHQFKKNEFERTFYPYEKPISYYNFRTAYLVPELEERLNRCIVEFRSAGTIEENRDALRVLRNEIMRIQSLIKDIHFRPGDFEPEAFNENMILKTTRFLSALKKHYISRFSAANREKERYLSILMEDRRDLYYSMLDRYHNENVADHVKKIYEKNPIIEDEGRLYQQIDPIFMDPAPDHRPGWRTHFFAPRKRLLGKYFETFAFNIGFIWFLTVVLYILLYFDLFGKLVEGKPLKRLIRRIRSRLITFTYKQPEP